MDTKLYPAQVFWSAEDEGFIASAADLPGCSAFGATQEEAIRELQDAISAWIEAARAAGNPVPSPSAPGPKSAYSGKFLVRMPTALHAELAATAEAQGTSLNQYVVYLLAKRNTETVLTVVQPSRMQTLAKLPTSANFIQINGQMQAQAQNGVAVMDRSMAGSAQTGLGFTTVYGVN